MAKATKASNSKACADCNAGHPLVGSGGKKGIVVNPHNSAIGTMGTRPSQRGAVRVASNSRRVGKIQMTEGGQGPGY